MTLKPLAPMLAAVILAGTLVTGAHGQGSANLTIPVGSLTAFPTVVHTGTHPTLTWDIAYPSLVQDYVDIEGGSTVAPKQTLNVEVRVIGAGVTVTYTNGTWAFVPTEALVKYHNDSYARVFYGTNNHVNPGSVVFSRQVLANRKLRFGGRYYFNNAWGPLFNSDTAAVNGNYNVRTLVNGDIPPTYTAMNGPSLEEFVAPYLDASGRVKIGPMDAIVFMELTHYGSQYADPGYDMQDMVLLVTFKVP